MAGSRARLVWIGVVGLVVLAVVVGMLLAGRGGSSVALPPNAGSGTGSADELEPVPVAKRDFSLQLTLDAETVEGRGVLLQPHPGLAARVGPIGGSVARGQLLGQLLVDPTGLVAAQTATSGATRSQMGLLRAQTGPLRAPVAGELVSGEDGPAISAAGIDVVAQLSPIQALRFASSRFTGRAVLETVVGQRIVPCDALWVQRAKAATVPLHCRVPGYVETVAGLRATLQIQSPIIKDAVVVPTSALRYDRKSDGYSVTILQNGAKKSVPVTVGLTDGVARVITSPLPVGAQIVFPPGGEALDQFPPESSSGAGSATAGSQPAPGATTAP